MFGIATKNVYLIYIHFFFKYLKLQLGKKISTINNDIKYFSTNQKLYS